MRLLALLPVLMLACGTPDAPSTAPAGRYPYRNMDPSVAYVGREACRSCHPDKYETFVHSQMGRSFKPATLSNSAARFDGVTPIYDATLDLYYRPFHRGEALFIEEYRLAGTDTTHRRVERIDYIVGSGQHTNSHIMEEGGYFYQMPLTWYVQEGRWDLPPAFDRGRNRRFSRPITLECMTCHNGRPDYVRGSYNRFRHVPSGIGCEQCHGPGALHIREKQAGQIVDVSRDIDDTIVNPRKLPVDRQIDVCQRCHLQGTAVPKAEHSFLDFRPGGRLSDVLDVYLPRSTDSVRTFIMASHPDRLRLSACFAGTHAPESPFPPLSCISCHNPHVALETMTRDTFNGQCRTCHAPDRGVACTEAASVRARNGDDCVTCHMPTSGAVDIPHVRITDHYIRVPDPPAETTDPAFVRLVSRTKAKPTNREMGDGYLTYFAQFRNERRFLDSAAVYLAAAAREEPAEALAPSQVRLAFLQEDHAAVIRLAPFFATGGDAMTLCRIGQAYAREGRYAEAIGFLTRARNQAPDHLECGKELANAYVQNRQYDAAVAELDRLLAAQPKWADAYNNRGFARIAQALAGDPATARPLLDAAEADFRQALALNPDEEQALANLASLYLNTGRRDEARPLAEHLVRLHPENAGYRQLITLLR